ncbi:HAD family hydrolase [Pseudodesulfovibrio sp. zrk46]|uniref:HAD family hydrolase n=1 Tax=Pseudodesulfovibrio sp. zrk46 TaxID=2725288 RepID=UPI001449CF3E|nr:HAD family hydrolase [Pseudodesulfovibrio sp. zrk46]QJB57094.1 HAD family hydrolase [Pseudodesulfovibrio sp. zrk46]
MLHNEINVIAFDADDTLWVNEPMFTNNISKICEMLAEYGDAETIESVLQKTQVGNIDVFGYGSKSFTLSMVETALAVSGGKAGGDLIQQIVNMGKDMNRHPIELIDGVEEVLQQLGDRFKLMMITKGDLVEQERKIHNSGLADYFSCIEVLSEKDESSYAKCLGHHGVNREEFLMVGNSVKSDILPVINIGAQAVHIPFHTTWCHETVDCCDLEGKEFVTMSHACELLPVLLSDRD